MTRHGEKFSEIRVADAVDRLQDKSDGKTMKRFVAVREYLHCQSPAAIEEKHGWPEQTIYSWLNRLKSCGLVEGLYDDPPPGRPPALADGEFEQFRTAVQNRPEAFGLDARAWSTALAQQYLQDEFDQTFSRRHVRRLLIRAGLS